MKNPSKRFKLASNLSVPQTRQSLNLISKANFECCYLNDKNYRGHRSEGIHDDVNHTNHSAIWAHQGLVGSVSKSIEIVVLL